jgi:hypothetical protein
MKGFNDKVKEHIGEFDSTTILQTEPEEPEETLFVSLPDGSGPPVDEEEDGEDTESPFFDPLVRAEVILPHKDGNMMAKVVGCKQDLNGNLVGRKHKIPILDSRVYEVKLRDRERQHILFNIMAEHLLSQIDEDGCQYQIFKEIVDHCRDPKHGVEKADQYYTRNG